MSAGTAPSDGAHKRQQSAAQQAGEQLAAYLVGMWRWALGRQAPDGSHVAVADVLVPGGQADCIAREAGLWVLPGVEQAGAWLSAASSEQAPVNNEPEGPVLAA